MTFSVLGSVSIVPVKGRIPDERHRQLIITHAVVYVRRGGVNRVPSDGSKRFTVNRKSVRCVPTISPRPDRHGIH